MTLTRTSLVLAFFLSVPGVAGADVIDPSAPPRVCPPMTCPPGSYGVGGGHSGCPYDCSVPTACDDTPCSAGSTCEAAPVSLCIERVNGGNYEFEAVREACVDGACPAGQTCWTHRRCVPDPSPAAVTPSPVPPVTSAPATSAPVTSAPVTSAPASSTSTPTDSGGMCSARAGGGPSHGAMVLVLATLLLRARRR